MGISDRIHILWKVFIIIENERFRTAKPNINLMNAKVVIVQAMCLRYRFRDDNQAEMGLNVWSTTVFDTGIRICI